VIGKNHKGALLTINDRTTGLVWIRLLSGKGAAPLTEAAIKALLPIKDHGKEEPMKTQMDLLGNTFQRVRILETLHLYCTSIVFTVLNLIMLSVRIKEENEVLKDLK
jgi:hypothetical protein